MGEFDEFVAPEVSCSWFNSFVGGVRNYGIAVVYPSTIKKTLTGKSFFLLYDVYRHYAYLVMNDKIIFLPKIIFYNIVYCGR